MISRLVSLDHPMEIQPGMVFALETYWPASDGWSAARIEEEVVVTPTGHEVITRFPAEQLLVAGTRYFTATGPLPLVREDLETRDREPGAARRRREPAAGRRQRETAVARDAETGGPSAREADGRVDAELASRPDVPAAARTATPRPPVGERAAQRGSGGGDSPAPSPSPPRERTAEAPPLGETPASAPAQPRERSTQAAPARDPQEDTPASRATIFPRPRGPVPPSPRGPTPPSRGPRRDPSR